MASREWGEKSGGIHLQVFAVACFSSGVGSELPQVLTTWPAMAFPFPSLRWEEWARGRENRGISGMTKPATKI